ncbi:MAG TPA: ABC transporter permease [Gemmatimonadaceae bacterium]|nr:ABC transporter permease [Gemmatimonadaceae bacterium]
MSGRGWRRAFRLAVGKHHVDRAVDEELAFHIEMRTRKLMAAGLTPEAARAQALQQFGDMSAVRTECLTIDHELERAMTRTNHLDDLRKDMGYAVRTLTRQKGFSAVMLLILALGIGANTAIFTLIDAFLLRTLPVPHPEQLITIGDPTRTGGVSEGTPRTDIVSYPVYADLRDQNHAVTGLYASGRTGRLDVLIGDTNGAGASVSGGAEHPRGRFVSGNYFRVLQVPAYAGRTFAPDEDRVPGDDPVVVISYAYWQQRFAGARSAIGRTITVNGTPLTIIGVTPPGFTGDIVGQPTEMWLPLMMQPSIMPHSPWLTDRSVSWLILMGRLTPGVTLAQARTEFATLERRSLTTHAAGNDLAAIEGNLRDRPVQVESGARGFSYYRSRYATSLITLMAAVVLVLLVVCANVANLMLSRAAARGREMSVRMALGAGRWRLIQQLLTESILLAVIGGALGLLLAFWGSTAILRLAGFSTTPIDAHPDGRILAFTALLSLVTAVLFGLMPALRATRVQLAASLRTQGRGVTGAAGGPGKLALGKLLVVGQVALSMLLLVGTGMLVRSTQRLEHADLGLARDHLTIAEIDAGRSGYKGARLVALMRDLTARVQRIPGVAGVSLSENGIFSGTESGTTLQVEGFQARADSDTVVAYDDVAPNYFHAIGAHILRGRDFDARDNESGPKVAILNETMVRFFFPNGDAIGHHLTVDSATYEIVGVVADVQDHAIRKPPLRRLYMPMVQMQEVPSSFKMEIRSAGDPAKVVVPVRRALLGADPSLVVLSVDPLTDLIRDSISQDRLVAQVVMCFGVLALVLAALGLYGVMAYATVRRTSEFGLRMALGAEPGAVTRLVLREAMLLVAGGVLLGLPVALLATRLLAGQLFDIGLVDPPSIALAVAVLGASALLAGYLPARRAASVAPLVALRSE